MCCVAGSAGEKDLLCLCLFRTVLDAAHALLIEAADLLQLGNQVELKKKLLIYIWLNLYKSLQNNQTAFYSLVQV